MIRRGYDYASTPPAIWVPDFDSDGPWRFELAQVPRDAGITGYVDTFDTIGTTLAGKQFASGMTWQEAGDADAFSTSSNLLIRTANADAEPETTGGHFAFVQGTPDIDTVSMTMGWSLSPFSSGVLVSALMLRFQDVNNYLLGMLYQDSTPQATAKLFSMVAGIPRSLGAVSVPPVQQAPFLGFNNYLMRLQLVGNAALFWATRYDQYDEGSPTLVKNVIAPASGAPGVYDAYTGVAAITRAYDFFGAVSAPPAPKPLVSIGELTAARDKQISVQLDNPGSVGFNISLVDDLAYEIESLTTCILAYRGDAQMWSGPVWSLQETAPGDRLQVNALGWPELLKHRLLLNKLSFTDMQDMKIISILMRRAQTRFPLPIGLGVSGGAVQTRTRAYDKYFSVGQALEELSVGVENGFDYEIDPITRLMNMWRKIGIDLPDVNFGYNAGADNLKSVTRSTDAARMANYISVSGKFAEASAPPDTPNSDSQLKYGMFEEHASLSDVTDPEILLAYAGAEVLYREVPLVTFDFTPKPWREGGNVPRIFRDYFLGDTARLSADKGRLQITDQPVRIFGATISPNEEGLEQVSQIRTVLA